MALAAGETTFEAGPHTYAAVQNGTITVTVSGIDGSTSATTVVTVAPVVGTLPATGPSATGQPSPTQAAPAPNGGTPPPPNPSGAASQVYDPKANPAYNQQVLDLGTLLSRLTARDSDVAKATPAGWTFIGFHGYERRTQCCSKTIRQDSTSWRFAARK